MLGLIMNAGIVNKWDALKVESVKAESGKVALPNPAPLQPQQDANLVEAKRQEEVRASIRRAVDKKKRLK